MHKKLYRWEIALIVGLLVGILNFSPETGDMAVARWPAPEACSLARYQVSLFPFAVGHGAGEVAAPEVEEMETEIEIRYYFPELWEKIRDAIGL